MNLIIDWLKSLESKKKAEIHIKINKDTKEDPEPEPVFQDVKKDTYSQAYQERNYETYKNEKFDNYKDFKEVETMTLTEKYWLTLLFVFLRYISILMFGSGIGFIIAGWLVNPWWFIGLASWPLFIMVGVVNLVYIAALTKQHKLQFRYIVNGY